MKSISSMVFFSFFALTYIAQMLELANTMTFTNHLDDGETGLPDGLATQQIAENDPKYTPNLRGAIAKRNSEVLRGMLEHTIYFTAAFFFLTRTGRSFSMKTLNKAVGSLFDLEFAFLTLLTSMLSSIMFSEYMLYPLTKHPPLGIIILYCLLVTIFVIPVGIFITIRLLRIFNAKFILACYFSYFLLELNDILSISSVNGDKMEKMSPEVFSSEIQGLIRHQNLSDSIYKEREPGENVNAALIGIGEKERIEIYGKVGGMDEGQLESILIHEVGHSYHRSLIKKLSMFFLLLFLEMLLVSFLYRNVAEEFMYGSVSKEGSFIVLAFLYFVSIRPWLFIAYNMTSQNAEVAADLLTKTYHHNTELANTLYRISMDSFDFLAPSRLYNALNSMHPSILSRIEYLVNKVIY